MLNEASQNVVPLSHNRDAKKRRIMIEDARDVFQEQAKAIAELSRRVDDQFARAVEILYGTTGKVVILGVGKSGIIGRKIAATLASTGTPSFFVQAGEAYHGDLGMISPGDSAVLISQSGKTDEVVRLLPHLRRMQIPMIAFTGNTESALGMGADVALDVSVEREVCPNNLAPTNSTLAALAMGDALAVTLMRLRGFAAQDFARYHPGGSLGQQLSTVSEAMRRSDLPVVSPHDTVGESLMIMTEGRLGLVLVMQSGRLVGLVTDGDLRRAMQRHDNVMAVSVSEIMTTNPVTVHRDTALIDAHRRMQQMKLKALVVVDNKGLVEGVVEVFEE
jgi:arabinose-5-phosphate isomerase